MLIARALAGEPDLLVMDEPTAGVDCASQEALAEVLARLADRGTTMLIVTHELGPLTELVDPGGRASTPGASPSTGPGDVFLPRRTACRTSTTATTMTTS